MSQDDLAELRARTDMPLFECKKALYLNNNDVDDAEKWLLSKDWKLGKLITYRECRENE
jgi:translation elongation factor EF-Ts